MSEPQQGQSDGVRLFKHFLRIFPGAQIEDYYKNGKWLIEFLIVDTELVTAHRIEAGAPEPIPEEEVKMPPLPTSSPPRKLDPVQSTVSKTSVTKQQSDFKPPKKEHNAKYQRSSSTTQAGPRPPVGLSAKRKLDNGQQSPSSKRIRQSPPDSRSDSKRHFDRQGSDQERRQASRTTFSTWSATSHPRAKERLQPIGLRSRLHANQPSPQQIPKKDSDATRKPAPPFGKPPAPQSGKTPAPPSGKPPASPSGKPPAIPSRKPPAPSSGKSPAPPSGKSPSSLSSLRRSTSTVERLSVRLPSMKNGSTKTHVTPRRSRSRARKSPPKRKAQTNSAEAEEPGDFIRAFLKAT